MAGWEILKPMHDLSDEALSDPLAGEPVLSIFLRPGILLPQAAV